MTDEELATTARDGDATALDTLARRHRRAMRQWALYAVGDRSIAEDVAQEALVRLVRFIDRYEPGRPFLPWLRSLVRTAAADLRRSEFRLARPVPSKDNVVTLDRDLDLQRAANRALEAFAALTPRQREALVLCDRRGLRATEAAEQMGVEASTVRALVHQARRAVRSALLSSDPDLRDLVRQA